MVNKLHCLSTAEGEVHSCLLFEYTILHKGLRHLRMSIHLFSSALIHLTHQQGQYHVPAGLT